MLNVADTDAAVFPPTILYNEGWMLRLVLSAGAEGISCIPFSFLLGSKWFSEAMLPSPFPPRSRPDQLAETWTHLDGVVGHFKFTENTRVGLELVRDSKQFVVIEAKMYAPLSRGTKNAKFYDQAARTVACMTAALERVHKSVSDFESIGYYVMAPEDRISQGVFTEQMTRESIIKKIQWRIEMYQRDSKHFSERQSRFQSTFLQLIKRIDLRCWSWEDALRAICDAKPDQGASIKAFYKLCQKYNKKTQYSYQIEE
jgi:hypothetical protein